MKNLLWFCTALALLTIPFAAEAQFPKPRPASAPQNTQAEIQAPAPTVIQAAPPVVNVAAPNVAVSPQLVAPVPSGLEEIKSWLNTIFGGLIAALLAKIGFKPAAPPVVVAGAVSDPVNVLMALKDKVTDPAMRARIDETLLTVVGTGIPGKFVQAGLGAVPVAGPLLSGVEPLLRDAFTNFLKDRLAGAKPQ
jgi:hypothetical protein